MGVYPDQRRIIAIDEWSIVRDEKLKEVHLYRDGEWVTAYDEEGLKWNYSTYHVPKDIEVMCSLLAGGKDESYHR